MVSRRLRARPANHLLLATTLLAFGLTHIGVPAWCQAQASSPITSSGLNTTVTKSATTFEITGGTRPGNGPNLFHSFGEFGIPANHVANFLNDSGLATTNILGRVTGGNPSNIFGTIQTTGFGNANLLMMNPAGIIFGPNSSLNVGGSVTFTTADYLRLGDGARFTAMPGPQDAAISSAPVAAFGFLGSNPSAIVVQGSQLILAEGNAISLIGGNVHIGNGTLPNGSPQAARLSAPGGQINLVAAGSAGEVSASSPTGHLSDPALGAFTGLGSVSLSQGTTIGTSGNAAGRIVIRAGQFTMEDARLEAISTSITPNSVAAAPGSGDISIQVEEVALSHGANVLTSTVNGKAGNIVFEAITLHSNVHQDGTPLPGAASVTIASTSTGLGGPGSIFIRGKTDRPADAIVLNNTRIITEVSHIADPTAAPGNIELSARQVELGNGTVLRSDTTGGADAGAITLNLDTLKTQAGPEGRVLISSDSNCGGQCVGGQAGYITIQGIPGVTPPNTRLYRHVTTPDSEPNRPITYYFAQDFDISGTDIHSDAIGNAPGGIVMMRTNGRASFVDSSVSVTTQDFEINGLKPNGQPAQNQGFSRIDIMGRDITLRDSTIRANADVSDIGSCPLCQGGPSAGEIWLRAEQSFTADNSLIANTSRGRAQAGITKIIKDHYFSFGAIWDTTYPDTPTGTVRLNHSEVTVEAQGDGLPGYLRIRADNLILNHSIVNSKVNNVTNVLDSTGQLIDVVGAGEAGTVLTDGRSVQGSLYVSAKNLDMTGGGIIAPTQGNRIANRIELHADVMTTRPGTEPGGIRTAPRILDAADPNRVVISSSSTSSGGAGMISISGESVPIPDGAPYPPSSAIHLTGTDVLTDTSSIGLGGKIELRAAGPIELHDTVISANVTDLRPQSVNGQEHSGNINLSAGRILMDGGGLSALSRGTRGGGNISLGAAESISMNNGASVSAGSRGLGNAGNITINAGAQFLSQQGILSTTAKEASGGNITVQATDSIRLVNSQLTTSVHGGPDTAGGNILLDPAVVTLQNSQVLAQAVQGTGGNIRIIAGTFLADQTSAVSASSEFGLNGSVSIQSPVSSLSGTLATLPQRPLSAQPLFTQRCAAQAVGSLSSLVVAGRDRLPAEPGGWLMSPLSLMAAEADDQGARPIVSTNRDAEEHQEAGAELAEEHPDSQPRSRVTALVTGCRS